MGDFNQAVAFVLKNEGGFVDNPKDPGGATNHGISLRLLRSLSVETLRKCGIFRCGETLSADDVRDMTVDQAKLVYKYVFWDEAPFGSINSWAACHYIFDMAVLHGVAQAIKIAQRATWAVYGNMNLVDDGILGETTLNDLNNCKQDELLIALMAERAGFVRLLAHERPTDREFLHGWLNRCYRI